MIPLQFVNIADKKNKASRDIAYKIAQMIGGARCAEKVSGQTAGTYFTNEVKLFLENCFSTIPHLLPAPLEIATETEIYHFAQYEHLSKLANIMKEIEELKTIIGTDYLVKPDVVIYRQPLSDEEIGYEEGRPIPDIASLTPVRKSNFEDSLPFLHGIVSCKWTIRSDRSQNTRTEALNIMRNRKGKTPCITAITAEPLPSRIASLAFGLGDIDCVYHFALNELVKSIKEVVLAVNNKSKNSLQEQYETLMVMINSRRLRDISDLPFDLIT